MDAPRTFRTPISLVRCWAVYVTSPNKPKQAIKSASPEKAVKSLLKLKSASY
ncbi:hypothetical protein D3C72_2355790 [compost metagenome]